MAKVAGGASKKRGIIKSSLDKLRKKFIPTFGEQFGKAKKEGKKTFTSTRDDTTKGKLEYHTRTKAEEAKAEKKHTTRERARAGDTSKQLSDRGAKFKVYRKLGKKEFTHKGKKYSTIKKGGDKNWIQDVNKSIKARGTKGKCTPITKPGCTGRAKALAKTFKKMAKKRKS